MMGKLKVNFTTALFVFSFIICVIVAVVFVDRAPKNDYDSFYDEDRAGESSDKPADRAGMTADEWAKRKGTAAAQPTPAAPAEDPNAIDLPLDSHLLGAAQTVATPASAVATANPLQGRSPEEISRMLLNQGMPNPNAPALPPSMAMPGGIATPVTGATPSQAAPQRTPNIYLPMQSNIGAGSPPPGGLSPGVGSFPSPGGSLSGPAPQGTGVPSLSNTNATGSSWNPVAPMATPSNMVGLRAAPASADNGMMISGGKSKTGAAAPPGFTNEVTQDGVVPAPSGGGSTQLLQPMQAIGTGTPASQQQYLLQPQVPPPGAEKWDLPAAPTLRPPPIVDPDRPRADADTGSQENQTPGNAGPEGDSGQAVAVSGPAEEPKAAEGEKPVTIAARVNDVELTEQQALKLATANALITKIPLTEETRKQQVADAVKQWTSIAAAAEEARARNLAVTPEEIERFAAMRPDVDLPKWQQTLTETGFTPEEIQERLTELALSEKLVDQELTKKFPEKELKKVYEKTPKEFASPRQVHVLEIFKKLPEDEAKAKRVEDEMKRLQRQAAAGTDFGLLAKQASEAKNKRSGGDQGWVTPDENSEDVLATAVKGLKPGDVSPVVEGPDGLRIYKLLEEKPARDDFEGGKELVVEKLKKDLRDVTLAEARKSQNIELAPKGKLITARTEKKDTKAPKKVEENKPEEKSTAAQAVAKVEEKLTPPQAVAKVSETPAPELPATEPTPNRQTFAAAPTNQLLYAPGSQPPVQAIEGGAPAPPSQPGGLPVAPTPATMTNGYRPGSTIHVGESAQSVMDPAQSTTVNYLTNAAPQGNLTEQQQNEAIAREAQAMRARAEAEAQAKNQSVEMQIQRARLAAAQQENGSEISPQGHQLPSAQNPARGVATPQSMTSNGWTVTKTVDDPQQPARQVSVSGNTSESPQQVPPGFGTNDPTAAVAPAQPDSAAAPAQEPQAEREGGLVNNVKSFFSRRK